MAQLCVVYPSLCEHIPSVRRVTVCAYRRCGFPGSAVGGGWDSRCPAPEFVGASAQVVRRVARGPQDEGSLPTNERLVSSG